MGFCVSKECLLVGFYSVNVDQNPKDNYLKIPVEVKFEADLEVVG